LAYVTDMAKNLAPSHQTGGFQGRTI